MHKNTLWPFALFLFIPTIWLGYGVNRSDFGMLSFAFGIFFCVYFFLLKAVQTPDEARLFIFTGLALRLTLLFSFPALSDDIYRFIWDGRLSVAGINPFDYTPWEALQMRPQIPGLNAALYARLNSPTYYTVYPPVAQAVFDFACRLFPASIYWSASAIKFFLIAGEAGTIFLIKQIAEKLTRPGMTVEREREEEGVKASDAKKITFPQRLQLTYALNPLMIMEISGNAHFEGLMIFFLFAAFYYLLYRARSSYVFYAALCLAASVGAKLSTLLFLPFFLVYLGCKKGARFFLWLTAALSVLFYPLYNGLFFQHIAKSIRLYFDKFEFNASLYYIFSWIGYQVKGFNYISFVGPSLGILSICGMFSLYLWYLKTNQKAAEVKSPERFFNSLLWTLSVYFACATTVHPWYATVLFALSLFTPYRFPLIWSATVILSYSHYWNGGNEERYSFISLEYIPVLTYCIYETWFKLHKIKELHTIKIHNS